MALYRATDGAQGPLLLFSSSLVVIVIIMMDRTKESFGTLKSNHLGPLKEADESFLRKFTLSVEDRLVHPTSPQWDGGHRWFRSPNVIDLQDYRSRAEKERICINLLHHPEARYRRIKSA